MLRLPCRGFGGQRRSSIPVIGPAIVAAVAFAVAAFSGVEITGGDEHELATSDPIVATVVGGSPCEEVLLTASDPVTGDGQFLDVSAAAFTRCMQERGIDIPELQVGSDVRLDANRMKPASR